MSESKRSRDLFSSHEIPYTFTPSRNTSDTFWLPLYVQSRQPTFRWLLTGEGTGDFWDTFDTWLLPDIEPGMEGHSNGGFSDVPNWEIPKAPPKIKPAISDLLFPDLYKMKNKKRNQARVPRTSSLTALSTVGLSKFRIVHKTLSEALKFRYAKELWHACPTSFGRGVAMINPLTGEDYNGRFYQGNFSALIHTSGLPGPAVSDLQFYSGDKNTTSGGLPCMGWDTENDKYPHSWLLEETHNFCRNPDDGMAPWCYTADGWDLCFS